jgi:hypothetical protein
MNFTKIVKKHKFQVLGKQGTVCFANLDHGSEVIISEWVLTTFEASVDFSTAGAVAKIGLGLNSNHHK